MSIAPLQLIAGRLAELYPEASSLRRVVAWAGLDARRLPLEGSAANLWWAVTVEAHHQAKLRPLVEVALEEYPLDEWLIAAHAQLIK
jgi:hypothetical protein